MGTRIIILGIRVFKIDEHDREAGTAATQIKISSSTESRENGKDGRRLRYSSGLSTREIRDLIANYKLIVYLARLSRYNNSELHLLDK